MTTSTPAILGYADWLASSIAHYEKLAKSLVTHKPEKGRIVEGIVKTALRSILPGRFSIGTGFAINALGVASPQLDLVIYDGVFNAPVILEGGTGLFPIECIYGFVEVKSTLDGGDIESAAKAIGQVRSLAAEKRYVRYKRIDDAEGNPLVGTEEFPQKLPPRSFVFAVNTSYGEITSAEARLKEETEKHDAHVHALAVVEKDWLICQLAKYRKPHEFKSTEGRAFPAFCGRVLEAIQSITIYPAAMERYLKLPKI